jgi:transaldolase
MASGKPVGEALRLGQSIWCDALGRAMLRSGELQRLIDDEGLRGVTSNPTIFEKAIADGRDYESSLLRMMASGVTEPRQLYEGVVVEDVRAAADLLFDVWVDSDRADGFASIEVSPRLANDTAATIAEAHRLFEEVNRQNVMIKVPGTVAGMPAIERLIADGVNVNVTLLFGVEAYRQCAQAFRKGLERRAASGDDLTGVASVASFFLSRIDVAVDARIDQALRGATGAATDRRRALERLHGRIAVANAKVAWLAFRELYADAGWAKLRATGARVQRLLWASTGTKNPADVRTKYIDPLIGPDTVNTMPLDTFALYATTGQPRLTLPDEAEESRQLLRQLADLGVDLPAITAGLVDDGVARFVTSYDQLVAHLERARQRLTAAAAATEAAVLPH